VFFVLHLLSPSLALSRSSLPQQEFAGHIHPCKSSLECYLHLSNILLHSRSLIQRVDCPPTPSNAISPHKSDRLPTAITSIAIQITLSKMPAALSDTQNRYLAMAWLCIDAEPKVSTFTSVAQIIQRCAEYLYCKAVHRSQRFFMSYLMADPS
jgi:hypothetical protein